MRKRARSRNTHQVGPDPTRAHMGCPAFSRAAALRSLGPVVYAARVGGTIKIGYTTNLAMRLNAFGRDSELLAFKRGTYVDEQAIHASLTGHLHHALEWYYPTPRVMGLVNSWREEIGLQPVA